MSERERMYQLLDSVPDNKIAYIIGYIEGLTAEKREIEEVDPDEWDLEMIARAERENDGQGVPIESLAAELGIQL